MSKRIDNIVNELTNCIEEQIQTEVEMALGVRHRKKRSSHDDSRI